MAPARRSERILIVDDHGLFAQAVRSALERRGMQVVAVVGNAEGALRICRKHHPTMALVDLGLPGVSGLALGREILRESPRTKVLAVTGMRDAKTIQAALDSGFHGYVTKDARLPDLVESIKAVNRGEVVVPLRTPGTSHRARRPGGDPAVLDGLLTPREREVLRLLAEGQSNDEIAKRLSIARNTVRTHIQSILLKLGVHSRLEAIALASRYRRHENQQTNVGG